MPGGALPAFLPTFLPQASPMGSCSDEFGAAKGESTSHDPDSFSYKVRVDP
jgi:hypothetical protein